MTRRTANAETGVDAVAAYAAMAEVRLEVTGEIEFPNAAQNVPPMKPDSGVLLRPPLRAPISAETSPLGRHLDTSPSSCPANPSQSTNAGHSNPPHRSLPLLRLAAKPLILLRNPSPR